MIKKSYNKPESVKEVTEVMRDYCNSKQFNISDFNLSYMAEEFVLTFEARGWAGIKYWPALAKKWVLNNSYKYTKSKPKPSEQQKNTTRDKLLRRDGSVGF